MLKKLFLAAIAVFLFAGFGFSQTIVGSAHDFSGQTWNTSSQICIVCHTPHNANITVSDAPLWNHTLTAQTFQIYSSSTFNGTAGQPDGSSKLCLSCHDGSVALENYSTNGSGTHFISSTNNIGSDLRNDHPVSFVYDASLASLDGHLHNPTTALSGLGSTISANLLIGNKMQCSSCHDVHNASGISSLLRKSNVNSALCLTCHIK